MTELRLLGPVEALNGEGPVVLGGARPGRALVALFVAERNRLDLDALVDRCFDDSDRPDDPVPAIRTAVRRLRRALGDDTIATRPGGYELDLRTLDVDIDHFDELIAAGRAATDPVAAITSFRRALDLWRGRPFGDLGELEWLVPERIRLEESQLVALEGWHDAHLRNGTATEIIGSLEGATVGHPLRERFHRQLMHALYATDRQADALRAFQTYREAMAEAGLEPGPETIALEQRIVAGDPSLKASTEGRPLRGYRIIERLGEGAFSIVYRGTQPSVDRDVAIKQIRAELANRPDFIRRFEAEAHMVAHLEHPFIVPLYDYWREPGSAYLVMRLLPGGSLESSLLDGPWEVDRTARMVEQVGAALSTAHRSGVVHRDVKPANILLDDEGNSFLTDFGIALAESELVDPEASLSAGSPAYASPEQLRREPVGPSADVHGLAIAVYEALTGRLPFPDEPNQAALLRRQLHDPIPSVRSSRPDVPLAIDDVLQRATAKAAGERYQTVDQFVTAFDAALGTTAAIPAPGAATVIPTEERNPYKGLRAFDEADAADFAGRDRLVDQLVAELASNRVLAVVGPSGSGKSSAVRAGLLPALRRDAVPGSSDWFVATVMPGAHPDEELEAALLRVAAERPPGLIDVLRDGDRGISRALRQVLPDGGQLLLVIDQFEELFTLCDDEAARRRFLDGLAAAVTEERSRLHVILTLRADFYDRPLRYEAIGRLVRDATVPVLPLAADELERAIVDPARSVGAEFEPGLVSEIAADVADQPGALPLLQYALTELYDRRISNLLTRDAYDSIGGVTGALAARAEDLHGSLGADERVELRRLFGRLVTLGEGTEDTRRRVVRGELGGADTVDTVIDRLGRARLLSFDRDPVSREPTIEVAHEALLREWPRLRTWLDDDRDGLRTHRHLTETTAAWIASGRDSGELYRGGRLETASIWATDHGDDLNEAEREFLAASVAQRTAEEAAERRRVRRLYGLVAATAIVAVLALIATGIALLQRDRAEEQSARSSALALAAVSASLQADNPALALALAAESMVTSPSAQVESMRAMLGARIAFADRLAQPIGGPLQGHTGPLAAVAFSPDGMILASAGDDGTVRLWDPTTGALIGDPLPGHDGTVRALAFSPDGTRLATAGSNPPVQMWNAGTRQPIRTPFVGHSGVVITLAFSPDGAMLVTGGGDGTVRRWIAATGEPVGPPLQDPRSGVGVGSIRALAFSRDGGMLASSGDQTDVRLWDPATGDMMGEPLEGHSGIGMSGHDRSVFGLAFSPDDTTLASVGDDGTVRLWDPATGDQIGEPLRGHAGGVRDVAFSPDSSTLATVGIDWTVRLWNVTAGQPIDEPIEGNHGSMFGIAFSPDGTIVASGNRDGTVQMWNPITRAEIGRPLQGHDGVVRGVAFGGDGRILASASDDGTVRLWDSAVGRQIGQPLAGHDGKVFGVALNGNGTIVASAGFDDGTVRLWDTSTGTQIGEPLRGHAKGVRAVAFSPDGTVVASGGDDRTVRLWDTSTGSQIGEPLQGHSDWVLGLAFSADGSVVASASEDRSVRLWNARSGDRIGQALHGHTSGVQSVAFSPNGAIVASVGSADGTIRLWDAASGDALGPPLQGASSLPFFGVAISKDSLLVSAGDDMRLWDVWDVTEACRLAALFVSSPQTAQYLPAGDEVRACGQPA